jgi:hypothetical protein
VSTIASPLVAHAWVALRAEDPEASSARAVAGEHLEAARQLAGLRRYRVFALRGALPEGGALEDLLHRSTQFYNPSKERCFVRRDAEAPGPVERSEAVALVVERGGDRRAAAERWWRHETGGRIEVREGVAWVMRFDPGADAARLAEELAVARDRGTGLFCNPHAQDVDVVLGHPQLERWPGARRGRAAGGRGGKTT